MRNQVLQELELSQRIVREGHEVVPRFRVLASGEEWTIFCPLPDDLQARVRGLGYIREFMAWKGAHGAIMSAETWLGPLGALQNEALRQGEAIVSTLLSKTDVCGVMRMINRAGGISFGAPQWFGREHVDPALLELLPKREEKISPEMMRELKRLFGKGGEFEARKLN